MRIRKVLSAVQVVLLLPSQPCQIVRHVVPLFVKRLPTHVLPAKITALDWKEAQLWKYLCRQFANALNSSRVAAEHTIVVGTLHFASFASTASRQEVYFAHAVMRALLQSCCAVGAAAAFRSTEARRT